MIRENDINLFMFVTFLYFNLLILILLPYAVIIFITHHLVAGLFLIIMFTMLDVLHLT